MCVKWLRNSIFLAASLWLIASCSSTSKVVVPEQVINLDTFSVQPDDRMMVYRETRALPFDLIHTKLQLKFDFTKQWVLGTATLSLSPRFYKQDSVVLDAVGMEIHKVWLNGSTSSFKYNGNTLSIELPAVSREDTIEIKVEYTGKPNELLADESGKAIRSDKGLYFINPNGESKNKPIQIWTQGETEANSHWFPTIDSPNAKSSQEMEITVDEKYKTLSNGEFMFSSLNGDGTRTDYWKQSKAHAPYLFMMAIGEFAVVEEESESLPISYWVEPAFEKDAKAIFKHTPEMIDFFSKKFGVKYPWDKYDQVVVRDYVSGAMENTSAVIYGEFVQKTRRELLEGDNQNIVAHELSHHWFGDLVTCESWSNLTLNESFATYAPYMWREWKYGKDDADAYLLNNFESYLQESSIKNVDLVRFYYKTRDDMFDRHSYSKGSVILHMLRNIVGDDAFFASLKTYLEDNAYTAAEAHQLRLAFEKVTGKDMTSFFNQWYYASGHPVVQVDYNIDPDNGAITIEFNQIQDLNEYPVYTLPIEVELVYKSSSEIKSVMLDKTSLSVDIFPKEDLKNILIDPNAKLLVQWKDNKSTSWFLNQYQKENSYKARRTALTFAAEIADTDTLAKTLLLQALTDAHWSLRLSAIKGVKLVYPYESEFLFEILKKMAVNDPISTVRAEALKQLNNLYNEKALLPFYQQRLTDSSYAVIGEALKGIWQLAPEVGLSLAEALEKESALTMKLKLAALYAKSEDIAKNEFYRNLFAGVSASNKSMVAKFWGVFLQNLNHNSTTLQAVPVIESACFNEESWWVRFGMIETLVLLQNHYALLSKQDGDTGIIAGEIHSEIEKSITRIMSNENNPHIKRLVD